MNRKFIRTTFIWNKKQFGPRKNCISFLGERNKRNQYFY